MGKPTVFMLVIILGLGIAVDAAHAEQTVLLSTINWETYSGETLPNHGFFSEIVTEAFSRVGYKVEFQYRSWARALEEAKTGDVHGVMDAYWKAERLKYLSYPDVVCRVKEHFIALQDHPISYSGSLADLKNYTVGVLNASAQADELSAAGVRTEAIDHQIQNIKKLVTGRIDAMLIPPIIFFYYAERLDAQFRVPKVKVLTPPFKTYDMYVAFSKQNPDYRQFTADFNRGLQLIKADGTYAKIRNKHEIQETIGSDSNGTDLREKFLLPTGRRPG